MQQIINTKYSIQNRKYMYSTSPAFSIAGKYIKIDHQIKPTPLTYNCQNWNPKKTPSWKIGNDKKYKDQSNLYPGPGQYSTPPPQRSNKFGIFGNQNQRAKINAEKSPSPVSYSSQLIETGPSISFAKKYPPSDTESYKPGPGAYQKTPPIKTTGSIIGKQKRFVQDKKPKLVPGPGAYEFTRPSSAKVSFGKQPRECGKKLNITEDPGPGQYQQRSLFVSAVKSSKGFSLEIKTTAKDLQTKPGPGNYDPDYRKIYSSNPSYSIPRKYQPVTPDNMPAPNSYDLIILRNSFYTPFTKAKRQPFLNNKNIPGPGQYQTDKIFKSSPKFSLGMSRKNHLVEDFPGPGTYKPNKNLVKSRPQSAKIGKSVRYTQKRELSPGPGQYQLEKVSRPITPLHSFGKDSRMKMRIVTSPGPGEYLIPSSVGYVAPYVLK